MIGAIIQARMGSSRLPGKVLKPVGSMTLLEHILFRLTHLQRPVRAVVATSDAARDDILADFCRQKGFEVFRGSESNLLERYCLCARQYGFDQVIRLTGDNPFVDVEELDKLIALHLKTGADYSISFASLPVGVGAEIFSFQALHESYLHGAEPHHLEHVNEYILENRERFSIAELEVPEKKRMPQVRLTVDTEEDYRRACHVAESAGSALVMTEEAIELARSYRG